MHAIGMGSCHNAFYLITLTCLCHLQRLLKGTETLMIIVLYMKELYEPWILIPVSSKSVEKYGSYGRLNICKWTLMEAAIL